MHLSVLSHFLSWFKWVPMLHLRCPWSFFPLIYLQKNINSVSISLRVADQPIRNRAGCNCVHKPLGETLSAICNQEGRSRRRSAIIGNLTGGKKLDLNPTSHIYPARCLTWEKRTRRFVKEPPLLWKQRLIKTEPCFFLRIFFLFYFRPNKGSNNRSKQRGASEPRRREKKQKKHETGLSNAASSSSFSLSSRCERTRVWAAFFPSSLSFTFLFF